MSTYRHTRLLTTTNRVFIALLSLLGMLLDGLDPADLVLETAVAWWLWLGEFQRLELALLQRLRAPLTRSQ